MSFFDNILDITRDVQDVASLLDLRSETLNDVETLLANVNRLRGRRGFDLQVFKSKMESVGGVTRTNKFLVEFPMPKGLSQGSAGSSGEMLTFLCKSAPLPGLGIVSDGSFRYGVGPMVRTPHGVVVNDAMFQLYTDNNNVIRTWFRNWIRLIINPDLRNGMNGSRSPINNALPYQHSYREEYVVDIRITTFDQEGNPVISVVLVDAFPNYIGDVMLDWEDNNRNMLLPISISYVDWFEESVQ